MNEAAALLGVSVDTLRKWERKGLIRAVRTKGGHRRIPLSEVEKILGKPKRKKIRCAIYARVSSPSRKDDLERQIVLLKEFAKDRGWEIVAVIGDISSGLKERRRGLRKLFRLVTQQRIDIVLVTFKDRLTRFGFEYLQEFFAAFNVDIHVLFREKRSPLEELVEDFVAIVVSFAGRIYGKRSRKVINKIKEVMESTL